MTRHWPWLVLLLALVPAGVLVAGLLAPWWWQGDLAVHWLPLPTVAIVLAAAALARRMPRVAGGLVLLIGIVAFDQWPHFWRARAPSTGTGPSLQVAHANLCFPVDGAARRAALARALDGDPEVVSLVEADQRRDGDACSKERWPYQIWVAQTRWSPHDRIALLSRHPILQHRTSGSPQQPFLVAELSVMGQPLTVIVLHPPAPHTPAMAQLRREQLREVAAAVADSAGPTLALGDFNDTTRSPWWSPLTEAGLLTPAWEPATWPAVLGPVGITIDHILGRDLAIAPPRVIDLAGSDHRGLATTVTFLP